jgi:hypothetical protein
MFPSWRGGVVVKLRRSHCSNDRTLWFEAAALGALMLLGIGSAVVGLLMK